MEKADANRHGSAGGVVRTDKVPLPVFRSGRALSPAELDEELVREIERRAKRR
ncbi:hypothetical protein [Nocardia camponoti]|uniref:hypothetical protein n=1 Tax=Nocardia camponoti TaxID=1616106 RepID=UPI0016648DB4|nr:hypothetical protein [Nocardia camponoti]